MPVADRNTAHLAGEYLTAGELARRGYPVAITMGNAKSVDIYAKTQEGVVEVDAKALRSKSDWPIMKDSIEKDQFYVLVFLQTKRGISRNLPSEYFIAMGKELRPIVEDWGTMQGIRYSSLDNETFKNRWDKLPPP